MTAPDLPPAKLQRLTEQMVEQIALMETLGIDIYDGPEEFGDVRWTGDGALIATLFWRPLEGRVKVFMRRDLTNRQWGMAVREAELLWHHRGREAQGAPPDATIWTYDHELCGYVAAIYIRYCWETGQPIGDAAY